ncbi:MAG: DUF1559 domain-containing protein [Pirellulaceae bacterium]|nr:DUF1559 domain-containing protein [Pirellulaceae bacterium]
MKAIWNECVGAERRAGMPATPWAARRAKRAVKATGRRQSATEAGFSLVEMLVVISIIGILVAMLMPALHLARVASRKASCQNNLRQIYIGLASHADRHRALCSGAFDWRLDGCVTEKGWVADLVSAGVPVGSLLCPSNEARIASTYNDLLMMNPSSTSVVDLAGSKGRLAPDGTMIVNACRKIIDNNLSPGSEPRTEVVSLEILKEHYNTNYTASWYLVRSAVLLDDSGNLRPSSSGDPSLARIGSTHGPLTQTLVDSSKRGAASVPLMGCGAASGTLASSVGDVPAGTPVIVSFTRGPVENPSMEPPVFSSGTSRTGPTGWWAGWEKTLQDYRGFAPVHRGSCNILFADGSARAVLDQNDDGLLNNGFEPTETNGFADDTIELLPEDFTSTWSLRGR